MNDEDFINLNSVQGTMFSAWEDAFGLVKNIQKQTKQIFHISHSIPVNNYRNGIGKTELKYGWIKYVCKGEGVHESTSSGARTGRSYKVNCPAFIKFILTKNGQHLIIDDCNLIHKNHDNTEVFFEFYPENRRLSGKEKEEVRELLKLGANKTDIQTKLSLGSAGKFLAKKDLHNLAQQLVGSDDDSLAAAVDLLLNIYDATVDIAVDEENHFKGLYFSTKEMRHAMSLAPEIVFTDGTYKLLKLNLTLMLLLIENADGVSEVVGAGLLASEDSQTMSWFFETFKRQNLKSSSKIRCMMTDKDLVERGVLRLIFPDRPLYLCIWHTLKSFNRQVSTTEMAIGMEERTTLLSVLERLAKSSSETQYNRIYKKFKISVPSVVSKYFDIHWHPIRNEWARYSMIDGNLGNITNNRLESINGKVRAEIKENSSLVNFIRSFFQWFKNRNRELLFRKAQSILRKKMMVSLKMLKGLNIRHYSLIMHFPKLRNSYKRVVSSKCEALITVNKSVK